MNNKYNTSVLIEPYKTEVKTGVKPIKFYVDTINLSATGTATFIKYKGVDTNDKA